MRPCIQTQRHNKNFLVLYICYITTTISETIHNIVMKRNETKAFECNGLDIKAEFPLQKTQMKVDPL
jgi:hypothetical protein